MYIVLLGPPGVGKGTQSRISSNILKFFHFDTGKILRATLEKDLKNQINNGSLVPNNYIEKVLKENIPFFNKNVILDGIPRDIDQAYILSNFLKSLKKRLSLVIEMSIEYEDLKNRVLNRIICSNCNEIYNLIYKPFESLCKECNETDKITKREDDTLEIFNKRFEIYNDKINDIRDYYREISIYKKLEIDNNIGNTFLRVSELIKENK